jgi:hypothetical protein
VIRAGAGHPDTVSFSALMIAAEGASAALYCLSVPPRKPLYGGCFPTLDTPWVDSHVMVRGGTNLDLGIRLNNDPA